MSAVPADAADRLRVVARPLDHPDAALLLEAIQQYYVDIYGGRDDDTAEAADFVPPRGLFLIGYLDDVPVATGGWRLLADGVAEIKRMYVAEGRRGAGLARRMLAELEATAGSAGAARIVLSTGYRQTEAIAFYAASGYRPSEERFGHYADIQGAFFYAKRLR
jgi:ribosomal protein S18 acetylase RimI-like enzyme